MPDPGEPKVDRDQLPDVMTVEQLCSYLQIAKSTLYKLAQEGKVPGQKVGKHWRFHRAVIDEWLAENRDKGDARA